MSKTKINQQFGFVEFAYRNGRLTKKTFRNSEELHQLMSDESKEDIRKEFLLKEPVFVTAVYIPFVKRTEYELEMKELKAVSIKNGVTDHLFYFVLHPKQKQFNYLYPTLNTKQFIAIAKTLHSNIRVEFREKRYKFKGNHYLIRKQNEILSIY